MGFGCGCRGDRGFHTIRAKAPRYRARIPAREWVCWAWRGGEATRRKTELPWKPKAKKGAARPSNLGESS
jgi:hypothetical protein